MLIQSIDDIRTTFDSWTQFSALIYGPVGHGGTQGMDPDNPGQFLDFPIADWDAANDKIHIEEHHEHAFDPFDATRGKWRIDGGTGDVDDLVIDFGTTPDWTWPVEQTGPNETIITFDTDLGTEPSIPGNFQRPNKTIADFLEWWGDEDTAGAGLLLALEDVLGGI